MTKKKVYYFAGKRITLGGSTLPGSAYTVEYVLGEYMIFRRRNEEPEFITDSERIQHFHSWFVTFATTETGKFFKCKGKALRAFE